MISDMARQTLREQQKDLTRRILVDAALRMFAKKSFIHATIAEIAEEAGTSRATYYLYFSSKEELLRSLYEEYGPETREMFVELDAVLVRKDPGRFEQWVADHFGWIDDHRTYIEAVTELIAVGAGDLVSITRLGDNFDALHLYLSSLDTPLRELGKARITRFVDDIWITSRVNSREGLEVPLDLVAADLINAWCTVFDITSPVGTVETYRLPPRSRYSQADRFKQ